MQQPHLSAEEKQHSHDHLSLDLIEAQYQLKNSAGKKNAKSVLVLVSGIELAGKGESVKQLREWVDPRYLRVKA
ncbi:phosphate--AMP phosphotransferase, partial [Acinetobacter baumannii]|nr:phosphate--AMP phosphotransferase [Acinetobacter baumannii]